jgi:hypothetical protein
MEMDPQYGIRSISPALLAGCDTLVHKDGERMKRLFYVIAMPLSVLLMSACSSGQPSSDTESAQVSVEGPADWEETGFWPYDYGYGFGFLARSGESITGQTVMACEDGAQSLIDSGTLFMQVQLDAYLEGCYAAYSGQKSEHLPLGDYGPSAGAEQVPREAPLGSSDACDANYDGLCVPYVGYDLDCPDIGGPIYVVGIDIHEFDRDGDGVGCESN